MDLADDGVRLQFLAALLSLADHRVLDALLNEFDPVDFFVLFQNWMVRRQGDQRDPGEIENFESELVSRVD